MKDEMDKIKKEVQLFYSEDTNIARRVKFYTEGFTGRLYTHNFRKCVNLLSPYREGERVIDVGSGWGYLLTFPPKFIDLYSLDISSRMLEVQQDRRKDAKRICGDAHNIPFADGAFNKFFCINVTGHLPDPQKALQEMHRVLRPGGLAVINFLNKFGLVNVPVTLLKLKVGYYAKYDTFASLDESFSYFEARKLLERAGFQILQTYGWGISFPYFLGQKIPLVAKKMTEFMIKIEDHFIIKHLSNAIVFKVQKPVL